MGRTSSTEAAEEDGSSSRYSISIFNEGVIAPNIKRKSEADSARLGREGSLPPHRLKLVEELAHAERSLWRLAERVGRSITSASQHLQHMRCARLVTARRDGKFVFYALADRLEPAIQTACAGNLEQDPRACPWWTRSQVDALGASDQRATRSRWRADAANGFAVHEPPLPLAAA